MRKVICIIATAAIFSLAGCNEVDPKLEAADNSADEAERKISSATSDDIISIRINDELERVIVDGVDVTEEKRELERTAHDKICEYLGRDDSDLEFYEYCLLGNDGLTVNVVVDDATYTYTVNNDGEITAIALINE